MDVKLDAIQIFVSDINKAKKWYSEILGMKLIEENLKLKFLIMSLGKNIFYIETPIPEWGEGWNKVKIGGRSLIIFKTIVKDINLSLNSQRQTVEKLKSLTIII